MKDPRLGFAVTDVEVARDLRYATIYVSIYGEPDTYDESYRFDIRNRTQI